MEDEELNRILERIAYSAYVSYRLLGSNVERICEALLASEAVTHLDWSLRDSVTDHQLEQIVKPMLEQNQTIEHISLSGAWDDIRPGVLGTIFQGLQGNTTVERISVRQCRLHKRDARALGSDLLPGNETLKTLSFRRVKMPSPSLHALSAGIRLNASLEYLSLYHCAISPDDLGVLFRALQGNNSLKKLALGQIDLKSPINAETASHIEEMLASSTALEELNLRDCSLAGTDTLGAVLRGLFHSTSVRNLCINRTKLQLKDAENIAAMLRTNQSMHTLRLYRNKLGNKGAEAIVGATSVHPALRTLYLEKNCITSLKPLEGISFCNTLRLLVLSGNHFGGATAKELFNELAGNDSITELDIGHCGIGDEAAKAMGKLLLENVTLKVITMVGNQLSQTGRRAVLDGLRSNLVITYFNFGGDADDRNAQREADFYCALNQSGRKNFHQREIPDGVWPLVLNKMRNDGGASHLYYTLRSEPSLMSRRRESSEQVDSAETSDF